MSPPTETKVADIFEDSNKVPGKSVGVVVILFVTGLVVLYLYANSTQFILNAILSVITSFVAALIFVYTIRIIDNRKLGRLRRIEPNEYVKSVLQSIDRYKGAFVTEYKASVKFQRHSSGELLSLTINFEYKRIAVRHPVVITIHRLTEETDDPQTLKLIAQDRLLKEWVFQQDERTMPVKINPEVDYFLDGAYVDGIKCEVERKDEKDKITFTFVTPLGVDPTSAQPLEYWVRLPFEKESVLQLTHDFPTFNAEITVDYGQVCEEIDPYVLTMAGIEDNPIPWETNDPFLIKYKYRGWLNPQNGYVVVWWKK